MQVEDHLDFLASDDIRLKGSRIGIESVLYEYIHRGQSPEAIRECFPTLALEQIYAAILYYLHHREQLDAYMSEWLEYGSQVRMRQERESSPVVVRLRQ